MPPKPIQAPETFPDLGFPMRGVDLIAAYAEQRPGTTVIGINVRAYESITDRGRGGSRAGLSKYINDQLPGELQELTIVIDPQADAMGISFLDVPDLDLNFQLQDPSAYFLADGSPNWVYVGGSGYYTNKAYRRRTPPTAMTITANNITKANGDEYVFDGTEYSQVGLQGGDTITSVTITSSGAGSGASNGTYPIIPKNAQVTGHAYNITYVNGTMTVQSGIAFVQAAADGFPAGDSSPRSVAFTNPVVSGNLLLVCVATATNGGHPSSVVDTLGNTYTDAGATGRVSIWYCLSAFSGANTAQVSMTTGGEYAGIAVLEYSGVNAVPLDSVTGLQAGATGAMDTASIPVNNADSLVVGVFGQQFGTISASASGGNNLRVQHTNGSTHGAIYVVDQLPVSVATVINATLASGALWTSLGASFKKA